jgi:molybdate-binding protein/DNA-binding XRE family transcriptional regulator
MKASIQNRLAQVRKSRGVTAADLARRAGVSRQTIYAIEAGTYVPNTGVALRLARELEVTVDELFSLEEGDQAPPATFTADVLSATAPAEGQPVRIARIGSRWVGIPSTASPYYIPEADGVVRRPWESGRAELVVCAKEEATRNRIIMAGCDPAAGLLSHMVEKAGGVEIVSAAASSKLALHWLREGRVHIAGLHMEDPKTGEFNLPLLRKAFPAGDVTVVTFAWWEEGLLVAAGNPKGIRGVEDLGRKEVGFVNRETGSGSRALLDGLLAKAGIDADAVLGYSRIAYGHLAAAYCVASGGADACLATRSAAIAFGLDFIPLHGERYDLVMLRRTADLPAAQALLDVLQRAALRQKLELLAGYDTSQTGSVVRI